MRAGSSNPFRPGAGQMPPILAGRDDELALAERRLSELRDGRSPSQGFLLYGPRGNGKTVILDRIAARSRELGFRTEELPPAAMRDHDELVRTMQERAGLAPARRTGVQVGSLGLSTRPTASTRDVSRLLAIWIRAEPAPLVLVLDEAQAIELAPGASLFGAVQSAGRERLPLFVVVAGTPGAPRRLRDAGTFTERQFQRLPIGRLDRRATTLALSGPAEASGRPISEAALALLADESQDYPYFIQLLGSAAWDAAAEHGEPGISRAAAARGVASTRPLRARFYAERLAEAEDRGVGDALVSVASFFAGRIESAPRLELNAALDRAANRQPGREPVALRNALVDLGVIWEAVPGQWEMGIPSLADYVLADAARNQHATDGPT